MNTLATTIAAIATAKGYGGIGVVRVSGPMALTIGTAITGKALPPRQVVVASFLAADGEVIDEGLAIGFVAPQSFTGEDVVELHGHGGPVVLDCLLQRVLELGATLAKPGEFSERAFLNNKLDLTQAEAIASLIAAQSVAEAKAAVRSLQGKFATEVQAITALVVNLRQYVEAGIDFPEDELELLAEAKVGDCLLELQVKLQKLLTWSKQGALLADGVKTVIVGPVNAGKSSLLNILTATDAAIVTDIPGTTRDLLKETILLDGIKLELIDTAGLRETQDVVEREGVKRAVKALSQAELILLVVDGTTIEIAELALLFPQVWQQQALGSKVIIIANKIDLCAMAPEVSNYNDIPVVKLSARFGQGKELLLSVIKQQLGWSNLANVFLARRRHVVAIEEALEHINNSCLSWQQYGNGEVLAEELRLAQQELGVVTGEFSSEDLLDKIFSEFCIGK